MHSIVDKSFFQISAIATETILIALLRIMKGGAPSDRRRQLDQLDK
jgi:hypothetical protein